MEIIEKLILASGIPCKPENILHLVTLTDDEIIVTLRDTPMGIVEIPFTIIDSEYVISPEWKIELIDVNLTNGTTNVLYLRDFMDRSLKVHLNIGLKLRKSLEGKILFLAKTYGLRVITYKSLSKVMKGTELEEICLEDISVIKIIHDLNKNYLDPDSYNDEINRLLHEMTEGDNLYESFNLSITQVYKHDVEGYDEYTIDEYLESGNSRQTVAYVNTCYVPGYKYNLSEISPFGLGTYLRTDSGLLVKVMDKYVCNVRGPSTPPKKLF